MHLWVSDAMQASDQSISKPTKSSAQWYYVYRVVRCMLYIVSSSKTRPPSLFNLRSRHHPLGAYLQPLLIFLVNIVRNIHPKPPHTPLIICFLANLFLPKRDPLIARMQTTRRPAPPQPSKPLIVAIYFLVFAATGAGGRPFRYCSGDHELVVARGLGDGCDAVGCLASWESWVMALASVR